MEGKSRSRGFASMAEHKQREIARKGGRAAHEKGRAHEFSSEEARQAGRKGGEKVSANRQHMAEIGRRGGKSSASRRRTVANAPGATMPSSASDKSGVELEPTVMEDNEMIDENSANDRRAGTPGMAIPERSSAADQRQMPGM